MFFPHLKGIDSAELLSFFLYGIFGPPWIALDLGNSLQRSG
jgi:hypothetical protein